MYTKALKELSKQPKFQKLNSVSYKILAKVVEMIGSDSHDERLLKQLGIRAECIYKSTDSKWTKSKQVFTVILFDFSYYFIQSLVTVKEWQLPISCEGLWQIRCKYYSCPTQKHGNKSQLNLTINSVNNSCASASNLPQSSKVLSCTFS